MIKLEFSIAVAVYIILTACLVLLAWVVFEKRGVLKQFSSEKDLFWQCAICTYVYVDSRHTKISQCPRCGSYNKKEKADL
jgi:uncharacterized paraquat-inducible protein A